MAPIFNRGEPDATIHQTIGALNAKADTFEKNQTELKSDMRALQQSVAAFPDAVEEIVARILKPMDDRLKTVETRVEDIRTTVAKWKATLAVMSAIFALLGAAMSHFVPLKRWFNIE